MKKFLIIYSIFAIVMLVGIYFFTLVQETNKRVQMVFYTFASDFSETREYEPFMKYQTVAYRHLDTITTTQYDYYIFQSVAERDGVLFNQFSIYVMPNVAVNYAPDVNDTGDKTAIKITDSVTQSVLYDTSTDKAYEDYAVSYGIGLIGFYYYAFDFEADLIIETNLTDYLGETILIYSTTLDYIDADDEPADLVEGYTAAELDDFLKLSDHIQPIILRNVTLYLIFSIVLGAIIYQIIKRKKSA